MAEKNLDGLRVAILVTDDFEQVELTEPRRALDAAGATTLIVSPKVGQVQGFKHDKKGDSFKVDMPLANANPDSFDAVLLPGGALNADLLRIEPAAQKFITEIDRANKPIAVICHGGWLLISANLVRNRRMTSFKTIQDDIRNAGGMWEDSETVRDKNWVSSRQPDDIPAFNREMLALFTERPSQQAATQSGVTVTSGIKTNIPMGQDERLINASNNPTRTQQLMTQPENMGDDPNIASPS